MEEKTKAKYKDEMLRCMLANPTIKQIPRFFNLSYFYATVFKKEMERGFVEKLFVELSCYNEEVVSVTGEPYNMLIGINFNTQSFIDRGGFVGEWEKQEKVNSDMMDENERKKRMEGLKEENLELTNELNRQKIKTHWIPIIISALGFVIALGSLIYPIYSTSNNVSQDIYNTKISSIENKIENLNRGLIKESEELKTELYQIMDSLKLSQSKK